MRLECETSFYNDEKLDTDLTHAQVTADEAKAIFGASATASGTAEKVVTCENFALNSGATIRVFFENASTAAVPTLNVNDTGAKPILVGGNVIHQYLNPLMWSAQTYITFVYDGTAYNVVDTPGTYSVGCSTASATHAKETDASNNSIIMNGTTISVFFNNGYDDVGGLSINFGLTGARAVFFEDEQVSQTNPFKWVMGSTIVFTMKSGYWYVADSGATSKATEAGKVATNYLYMSTAKGLVISQSPTGTDSGVDALTTPNSRVVTDGFDVYKNGTTRIAHFGATTIIGENGQSQMQIDNTSLKFNSGNGHTNLVIDNNIAGTGKKSDLYVYVDEDERSYNNVDGTLNQTVLARLVASLVEAHTMTSADGDFVSGTTGISLNVYLRGYATLDPATGQDTPVKTLALEGYGGVPSITNGVLTYTPAEATSSEWLPHVQEWASEFNTGCTFYYIWVDFELIYPVIGVAMTVGTRKANSGIGTGSLSIGSNNVASGACSVALGKDLIITNDYGVVVGENNIPIVNASTDEEQDVAFAVGARGATPFAVLKSGVMVMSSTNTGRYPDTPFGAGTVTEASVTFENEYPMAPFIFLTLVEDNIPANRVEDYALIQIYLKSVDTTGFVVNVVNGSSRNHTFGFSWFAICPM